MRVLVTGAGGMLGTDLCLLLEREGHQVIRTELTPQDGAGQAAAELLDITDTQAVFRATLHHQPDAVIHTAAYTDVDGCERNPDLARRVNALGTWNMAAVCGGHHIPLIYISTDYVFDGEKQEAYTEFDTPRPLSHYGTSKLVGEQLVRQLCRQHFIVRTAWLFGVHGKKCFPDTILKLAQTRKEISVVTDQVGSPTHTVDLARALVWMLEWPLYGTYHVTNAGSCSWYQFARKTLELARIQGVEVHPIPASQYPSPTRRPANSVLRCCSLDLQGQNRMPRWEDALAEYIALRAAGH